MEEQPEEPPQIKDVKTVEDGPQAGFVLKVYEDQTPEAARKAYKIKSGQIGRRAVTKAFTNASGVTQHKKGTSAPRNQ